MLTWMTRGAGLDLEAVGSTGDPARKRPGSGQTFYRYTDKSGKVVIVDSVDKLPKSARANAEQLELAEGPGAIERGLDAVRRQSGDEARFNLPSFALGLGLAGVLVVVALLMKRTGSLFIAKIVGMVAVVALLGGLYLGLLRRSTGQSEGLMATPNDIINDAKHTVEQANEQRRKQQEMLDEIGHEGK